MWWLDLFGSALSKPAQEESIKEQFPSIKEIFIFVGYTTIYSSISVLIHGIQLFLAFDSDPLQVFSFVFFPDK